jgi:hypothetical protein
MGGQGAPAGDSCHSCPGDGREEERAATAVEEVSFVIFDISRTIFQPKEHCSTSVVWK